MTQKRKPGGQPRLTETGIAIYDNLPEVKNLVCVGWHYRKYYGVSIWSLARLVRWAEKHAYWKASNQGNVKIWNCKREDI